jgi:protein transport protein SEC24
MRYLLVYTYKKSPTGGKIICFQASLPNIGIGALSPTVIHKQNTTAAGENLLLEPTSEFYRLFSEECTKSHVCADMFVFGSQNIDVATLSKLLCVLYVKSIFIAYH